VRLLVLGGTKFIGRHVVETAVERGHEVTLFNRGITAPELFPELERIVGDRTRDLSALEGHEFDAVVDTSGYEPGVVRASARALADSVGLYVFVSTLSVYGEHPPAIDESAALPVEDNDEYGRLKVLCEREVESAFPERTLIARPCVVAGPHDPTDRFTHWARRLAAGGEVLAPGEPGRPVQLIDVRDLAGWIVGAIEEGVSGAFNSTGPTTTFGGMLDACPSDARLVWVPDEFLLEQGLEPWEDLPLWLPASEAEWFFAVDSSRAVGRGLRIRPLADTARGALAADPGPRGQRLTPEREADLLARYAGGFDEFGSPRNLHPAGP
jgi:2'-hydroxyisoflavone reductase